MKFYTELSSIYDLVFPLEEDTVNFLSRGLKPGDNVLDLACGTGQYSMELSKLGANVTGIDLNGEMIKIARKKSKDLNISFIEGDMTDFYKIDCKKYNLVFCIGNSIVHLNSMDDIRSFIYNIYKSLEDGAVMVLQTINFNRILKYNIDSLPTIKVADKGIEFIRKYEYSKGANKLNFITELIIKDGLNEQKYSNSVPLIMFLKEDAVSIIKEAGFKSIEVFGGFNNKEYNDDSYAMIIRAIK